MEISSKSHFSGYIGEVHDGLESFGRNTAGGVVVGVKGRGGYYVSLPNYNQERVRGWGEGMHISVGLQNRD